MKQENEVTNFYLEIRYSFQKYLLFTKTKTLLLMMATFEYDATIVSMTQYCQMYFLSLLSVVLALSGSNVENVINASLTHP